jgi:protein O-mannosyl-transferase
MKNRWLVFAAYLALTFLFYHKALQVYFLSDDWKLFYLLDKYGFSALRFNFESEFIRIIPCVLLSGLYFIFGIASAFPFHLLSVLLHALNAFLVFILAEKIFSRYLKNENRSLYSFVAGLIFISLPYQVEAVTWMSGTSDLAACYLVLLSLIFYFDYKNSGLQKNLFISVLFFLLAALSKESSLFLPLLIIVLEMFSMRKQMLLTVSVYFIPVVIYALLNKFLTGYFITPGVNIFTNMPFFLFLKNYFLYAAKFFALYRLLPDEIRDALKVVFEYKMIVIPVWCIALFIMYNIRKKASLKSAGKLMVLMLIAFIISLLPVIHLETSFVGSPQSDRYGYLPSVFFVILVSVIIALINKKVITMAALCLAMVWFYINIQAQNSNWVIAGGMVKKIVNEFKPADGISYITNIPDNYNGAYFLRNGLSDAVSAINHHNLAGQIQMISYHTITSGADKAMAERISESVYLVAFAKTENKIPASEKIFMLVPNTARYSYSKISDTSFVVTVKNLPAQNTFYYYSTGSLYVAH